MAYTVRREEMAALKDDWAQLLDQQPEPVPFLHPAWQQVWLDEFQDDRELLLYSVRDGDTLTGVAPLLRDGDTLSFIGHYSICDYMDFIVAPGRGRDVFSALLATLVDEEWSKIELRGLRDGSSTLCPSLTWPRRGESASTRSTGRARGILAISSTGPKCSPSHSELRTSRRGVTSLSIAPTTSSATSRKRARTMAGR